MNGLLDPNVGSRASPSFSQEDFKAKTDFRLSIDQRGLLAPLPEFDLLHTR
jgi:hypothetical protein